MQRGEVYEYVPVIARPGQSRARLIISSQGVNDADYPVVLGLQCSTATPAACSASVSASSAGHLLLTIEAVLRSRLGGLLHACTEDEMDAVAVALRAAQDL